MKRRSRTRRILKWAVVLVCLLEAPTTLVAWGVSPAIQIPWKPATPWGWNWACGGGEVGVSFIYPFEDLKDRMPNSWSLPGVEIDTRSWVSDAGWATWEAEAASLGMSLPPPNDDAAAVWVTVRPWLPLVLSLIFPAIVVVRTLVHRQRPLSLRWPKWVGLLACLLLASLWGFSLLGSLGYGPIHKVDQEAPLDTGVFAFLTNGTVHLITLHCDPGWSFEWSPSLNVAWLPGSWAGNGGSSGWLPIWMGLLPVGAATAILWLCDRRPPSGHCRFCGYNLTGNVSGTCPECGRKVMAP